ncbi:MAG: UDP-N-acetylglucosamine 1-carboxyvinyltransferase [Eubacteriales bacterium]|nr:UDP-N-acetylglucosamine 1-carboxyvinyltransferase [Eubacteriales bacterium]
MAKYIIEKSDPLRGEVTISGAKNAVLPLMAAALLSEGPCVIRDAPALKDVEIMCRLIEALGAEVDADLDQNVVSITAKEIKAYQAPMDLVVKMRASILVLGPLLARTGHAVISMPGGCAIGDRPIELHLKGMRALGADVTINEEGSIITCSCEQLRGATIYLDFPSVGATENIVMAACMARGTTIIENAAQEPEITDLVNFLNKMGARIKGAGTDTIKIEGVEKLHGAMHYVIPDRIESGTFMVAAAISRGTVLVKNVLPDHVKPVMAKLKECGVEVVVSDEGILVNADKGELISTDIKTLPYPGFPTDMQSPFMALLTTVEGTSAVIETVFENRYMHVKELRKMGASIKVDGRCAIIEGGGKLHGAKVNATDLRGGAAVVLAGLVAEGRTEVDSIYHIERGYEHFVEKLRALGGRIRREED